MLSAKKVSLGYSKKQDIAKFHFIKHVWKITVDHQSLKTERALTNQIAEYHLSEEVQYLVIPTEVLYQWSYEDRMKCIKFVRSLGKNDIKNQSTIDNINWENYESDFQLARKSLSLKLLECWPNVLRAETIGKSAINLLNHPTTLVLSPTT